MLEVVASGVITGGASGSATVDPLDGTSIIVGWLGQAVAGSVAYGGLAIDRPYSAYGGLSRTFAASGYRLDIVTGRASNVLAFSGMDGNPHQLGYAIVKGNSPSLHAGGAFRQGSPDPSSGAVAPDVSGANLVGIMAGIKYNGVYTNISPAVQLWNDGANRQRYQGYKEAAADASLTLNVTGTTPTGSYGAFAWLMLQDDVPVLARRHQAMVIS